MVESGTPAWLANVAALILKLCPLNLDPLIPEADRAAWTHWTNTE